MKLSITKFVKYTKFFPSSDTIICNLIIDLLTCLNTYRTYRLSQLSDGHNGTSCFGLFKVILAVFMNSSFKIERKNKKVIVPLLNQVTSRLIHLLCCTGLQLFFLCISLDILGNQLWGRKVRSQYFASLREAKLSWWF